MNKLIKFLLLAFVPALAFGGATSSPPPWVYPGASNVLMPVTLFIKNVPVLTTGSSADIATIAIPPGITRFVVILANAATGGMCRCIAETASGSLAAGTFGLYLGPNATGGALSGPGAPFPSGAGVMTNPGVVAAPAAIYSGNTIYINQGANSANAGTCSFYIMLFPIN